MKGAIVEFILDSAIIYGLEIRYKSKSANRMYAVRISNVGFDSILHKEMFYFIKYNCHVEILKSFESL
jgi:hypothetical protein